MIKFLEVEKIRFLINVKQIYSGEKGQYPQKNT